MSTCVAGTRSGIFLRDVLSGLDPAQAFSYSPAARSEQRATRVAARAERMRYEADIRAVGSALGSGLLSESYSADHGEVRSAWMPLECSGIASFRIAGRPIAPGKIGVLRPPGTRLSGSFFARMRNGTRAAGAVAENFREVFSRRAIFLRVAGDADSAESTALSEPPAHRLTKQELAGGGGEEIARALTARAFRAWRA